MNDAVKKPENFDVDQMLAFHVVGSYDSQKRTDQGQKIDRNSVFYSARYSLFVNPTHHPSVEKLGLAVEVGGYAIKSKDEDRRYSRTHQGGFWAFGPSLKFAAKNRNARLPAFLKLDLLAGTSFDRDLGLLSRAEISLNYQLPKTRLSLGMGLGALYTKIKADEGLMQKSPDEWTFTLGGVAGYSF